jgi:hypothetical protein
VISELYAVAYESKLLLTAFEKAGGAAADSEQYDKLMVAWAQADGLIQSKYQEVVEGKIKDPAAAKSEWEDVNAEDASYLRLQPIKNLVSWSLSLPSRSLLMSSSFYEGVLSSPALFLLSALPSILPHLSQKFQAITRLTEQRERRYVPSELTDESFMFQRGDSLEDKESSKGSSADPSGKDKDPSQ